MLNDVRITVLDKTGTSVLKLDASGEIGGPDTIQYEDMPSGNGAGKIPIALSYAKTFGRGYWRGRNLVEISEADNTLTQAVTSNLITTSDSLAGFIAAAASSSMSLVTGDGPGGSNAFELLGTGSNIVSNFGERFLTSISGGSTVSQSWWADFLQVTHGQLTMQFEDINSTIIPGTQTSYGTAGAAATRLGGSHFTATTNVMPHSDAMAGGAWSKPGGGVYGTSGPGGAVSINYTIPATQGDEFATTDAINVSVGMNLAFSVWCNPSICTSGGLWLNIFDYSTGSIGGILAAVSVTGADGRKSITYTVGAGVSRVIFLLRSNPGVGIIPTGRTVIFSQPMLELATVVSGYYLSDSNPKVYASVWLWNGQPGGFIIASGQHFRLAQPMVEAKAIPSPWYVPGDLVNTRLFLDAYKGFDPALGEDTQQAYLWDGALLTMRIPIVGVGTDAASGQPYITAQGTIPGGGNPLTIGAYGVGTLVGRRRYCGAIQKRPRQNGKTPYTLVQLQGLSFKMTEVNDTFTINATDAGTAIYECLYKNSTRFSMLSISAGNFPIVGSSYSGTKMAVMVSDMVTDILGTIPTGDDWCLRIGHDRIPRLVKVYTAATNTYTYNRTLPQGVANFEPLNMISEDEDVSNIFNSIMVIGDTDPATNQPVSATVQDLTSIALYTQIDANPVTKTGLKTVADCRNMATAMLNQSSLAASNLQIRVYTRNDGTVTNQPAGLSNGDVVRGMDNVIVTRFNDTGSVLNAVPDSDLTLTSGSTALWSALSLTPGSLGPSGVQAWISTVGAGAAIGNEYAASDLIDVAPGQVRTLCGWINAGGVASGQPSWSIWDPTMTTEYQRLSQTPGMSGRMTPVQWTVPNGVTQVVVVAHTNNCVVNSGQTVRFSQPSLDVGMTDGTYNANAGAPNVFGLVASVVTTVTATDRWQDVKFSAIEPDWNAAMAEQANSLANQILNNTQKPAQIASYIVSTDAFPATGIPSTGLVVSPPTFLAIFGANTNIVKVSGTNFTLAASATNWAWLNSNATWTTKQDPSPVATAILYAIFQTDATHVIGSLARAPVGVITAIPTAALPKMPVGTTFGVSAVTINSYSGTNGAAYMANITFTPTVTPPGGDPRAFADWGSGYLYWAKVNDTGTSDGDTNVANYVPAGVLNLTPSGTAVTDTFGPLGAGHAWQLAVQPVDRQNVGGPLAIIGLTTVQFIGAPTMQTMPSGVKSAGPTISSSSVVSRTTDTGLNQAVLVNFTETDYNTAIPAWLDSIIVVTRIHGGGTIIGSLKYDARSGVTTGVYTNIPAMATVGATVDFGIYYVDTSGASSATAWPTGLSNSSDSDGGIIDPTKPGKPLRYPRSPVSVRAAVVETPDANGSYLDPNGSHLTYGHFEANDDPGSTDPLFDGSGNGFHRFASAATKDVIGDPGGGVGDFHAGKARTGTTLPRANTHSDFTTTVKSGGGVASAQVDGPAIQSGVVNLDTHVIDGGTHGRTLLTALTSGQIDLSKAGVIGKTLDNVADGSTRGGVLVSDLASNRVKQMSDGTTTRTIANIANVIDGSGKVTGSPPFITKMPNLIVVLANVILNFSCTSGGTITTTLWITNNGNGGVTGPKWTMSDGSVYTTPTGATAVSGAAVGSGTDATNYLHQSTHSSLTHLWYVITWTPTGLSTGSWTVNEYTSQPTDAQASAAFADGGLVAVVSTAGTTPTIVPISGGTGVAPGSGGRVSPQ